MGQQTLYNDLEVNGSGVFRSNVQAPNLVYNTGDQSISGIKNFTSIPTVNNTGIYLNSNPSGYITGVDLSSYATQTYVTGISGELQTQINSLVENSNTIIGLSIFL
jgi:hypothetical protein